jgi:hypothetical protein
LIRWQEAILSRKGRFVPPRDYKFFRKLFSIQSVFW